MPDFYSEGSPHERQLNDLIVEYYHAAEPGRPLDQGEFCGSILVSLQN